MRFVVQAALLLFMTGLPAALIIGRVRAATPRRLAIVAYVCGVLALAAADLSTPVDERLPTCASPQGPDNC